MPQDYTYAVSRIRAKESSLLTNSDLEQLLSQKTYDDCIRFILEKGWGDDTATSDVDTILTVEHNKIWELMNELVKEEHAFDFFLVQNDFHNLKVSIKGIVNEQKVDSMFIDGGTVSPQIIYDAVEKKTYEMLPDFMQSAAKEAFVTLLQTSNGQLCDVIIDNAALSTVYELGQRHENEIVRLYTELYVASANIKMAVRCAKTKKSLEFIKRMLCPCESLNIDKLAAAASKSYEDICSYLLETSYKSAVESLNISISAFEKWCDDLLTDKMKTQKWEPFTIGPLVAYVFARENEIKAVRLILSGKLNDLDENIIRERLREMYG